MATTMTLFIAVVTLAAVAGVNGQGDLTRVAGASGADVVEAVTHAISESCVFNNDHRMLRRLARVVSNDGLDPNTYRFGFEGGIWQVNQTDFQLTQSSALVQQYLVPIRNAFNIDWTTVTWSDLRKPLYSGLAAMLTLVRASANVPHPSAGNTRATGNMFPRTSELQAMFYQNNLKSGLNGSAYAFTQAIKGLTLSCGTDKVDIAFLVDSSVSLSPDDFLRAKTFASEVVKDSNVNTNGVRVAFVSFSTGYTVHFIFNQYTSVTAVRQAIANIQPKLGNTDTHLALKYATDTLFTVQSGSRSDAARIAIVLTDGQSDDSLASKRNAAALRQKGVTVFVIGVGTDTDVTELNALASQPTCTHVQNLDQYSELDSLKTEIRQVSCETSVKFPAPTTTNNNIHTTYQCGKTNSFQIGTGQETTITIRPKNGLVEVFGSYGFGKPSASRNEFTALASSTRPVAIYIKDTTLPLFLTIQSDPTKSGQCGSEYDLDIVLGDHLQRISENVCLERGKVRLCTPLDLLKALYTVVQLNPVNPGFPNPCVNQVGHYYHHPYEPRRFIYCDGAGNLYDVYCYPNQFYLDSARDCVLGNPPVVTSAPVTTQRPFTPRPTTRPPYTRPPPVTTPAATASLVTVASGSLCANCTNDNWNQGKRFFAYPGNGTMYIMCTEYVGVCNVKQCAIYHKWNQVDQACTYENIVLDWTKDQYQTSPHPIDYLCKQGQGDNDMYFHPHPVDQTKYIQCDEFGDAFVKECQNGEIWSQQLMTCVPGQPRVIG